MKIIVSVAAFIFVLNTGCIAQKKNEEKNEKGNNLKVPLIVKTAFSKKYPGTSKITWEKENGNYEANWGGKSGEDNSAQFTKSGDFIEIVKAIPVSELPKATLAYVKEHYKDAKIAEAGRVTDANDKLFYEAEVNRKDIIFDEQGNFVKAED